MTGQPSLSVRFDSRHDPCTLCDDSILYWATLSIDDKPVCNDCVPSLHIPEWVEYTLNSLRSYEDAIQTAPREMWPSMFDDFEKVAVILRDFPEVPA